MKRWFRATWLAIFMQDMLHEGNLITHQEANMMHPLLPQAFQILAQAKGHSSGYILHSLTI